MAWHRTISAHERCKIVYIESLVFIRMYEIKKPEVIAQWPYPGAVLKAVARKYQEFFLPVAIRITFYTIALFTCFYFFWLYFIPRPFPHIWFILMLGCSLVWSWFLPFCNWVSLLFRPVYLVTDKYIRFNGSSFIPWINIAAIRFEKLPLGANLEAIIILRKNGVVRTIALPEDAEKAQEIKAIFESRVPCHTFDDSEVQRVQALPISGWVHVGALLLTLIFLAFIYAVTSNPISFNRYGHLLYPFIYPGCLFLGPGTLGILLYLLYYQNWKQFQEELFFIAFAYNMLAMILSFILVFIRIP